MTNIITYTMTDTETGETTTEEAVILDGLTPAALFRLLTLTPANMDITANDVIADGRDVANGAGKLEIAGRRMENRVTVSTQPVRDYVTALFAAVNG